MFIKGHLHGKNWNKAVKKPRPKYVIDAIKQAQKGRKHTQKEGFQKGHEAMAGTERTRFKKGRIPWNKGKGVGEDPFKLKLRIYRSNAKKKGIPFEVTLKEMTNFLQSRCVYCGEQSTGIDKIDNKGGYVKGNMEPCCMICNHMKNNLTKESFIIKIGKIVSNLENKN